MQLTLLKGYPDSIGKRFAWAGYGSGPLAYNPLTGDPIAFPRYNNYIDAIQTATSASGNYQAQAVPLAVGNRPTFALFYVYSGAQGVNSLAIATPGSGQTNGTFQVPAAGGGGQGAVAQVVIAGGAITAATLVSAGKGYTSAPTFTVAEGGTPGTLTATAAPASGGVPNGTNLSGESFQLSGFGGVY